MKKFFTVSDIHSYYYALLNALENKGFDINNENHILIICGDAFDRGEHSKELFSFLKNLANLGRLIYVRGNHEDLLESCVKDEILKNKHIGMHHQSNGTIRTIANITGYSEYDILYRTFDWNIFESRIYELLDFIKDNCVDYFELGDTIFVHGWLPTTCDEDKTTIVDETWRDGDWNHARWENGMEMWYFGLQPENSTVVCGHWHCSYGWSRLERKYKEFPNPTHPDFNYSFNPYIRNGIVAIDACTAYSHKVNCVVFDEEGKIIDAR